MKLGAQLYTLRDYTGNLEQFSETLKKVADIGYTEVQVSGTCDYEADWLKAELLKNGLKCVITHFKPDRVIADPAETVAFHKVFDCNRVGIGYFDLHKKTVEELCDTILCKAPEIKAAGGKLYYHNHAVEFKKVDGKRNIDVILERFSPDELGIIMDTYWVQKGGADPIEWLYKLEGRVDAIHYKDMFWNGDMAPIGEGNMNFEGIIAASEKVGVEHILVEQDNCNGEDPFDCLARSYKYLTSLGLK